MPNECILTSRENYWFQWAGQFANAGADRHRVAFPNQRERNPLTRDQILGAYRSAAAEATGGDLIVSAGHGGGSALNQGMVDLAPGGHLRLTAGHLRHPVESLAEDRDRRVVQTFMAIGPILTEHNVRRVIFISCNVGNSLEFLGAIAGRWNNRTVYGYRYDVIATFQEHYRQMGGRRTITRTVYYVYLSNSQPTTDADIEQCARNYPPLTPGNSWSASRPAPAALRGREAQVPPVSSE